MKRALALLLMVTSAPAGVLAAPAGPAPAPPAQQVIQEKKVNPKHLTHRVVRKLAHEAAGEHKRVLVAFGADWCVACALIDPVFKREENRALFRDWELVRVDVDTLPEGPVLGIPFDTIPFFMKLDGDGHVAGTLLGSDVLEGRGRPQDVDAAFARFLGT